jgi:curved DNA-binding protein CbpA
MGIFDRLGDVLRSYLNDEEGIFGRRSEGNSGSTRRSSGDPDLEAAFEELDEFLNRGKSSFKDGGAASAGRTSAGMRGKAAGNRPNGAYGDASGGNRTVPESLKPDFAELGLSPGASAEECKAAYKKLLKLHHPDRHAGHAGNMKKATEKSVRINAAFERIERWRRTGQPD